MLLLLSVWFLSLLSRQERKHTHTHTSVSIFISVSLHILKTYEGCLDGSVGWPNSSQVMISRYMCFSPESGNVLTTQSLEPTSASVSPSLPIPCSLSFFLSLSKINIKKKKSYEFTLLLPNPVDIHTVFRVAFSLYVIIIPIS